MQAGGTPSGDSCRFSHDVALDEKPKTKGKGKGKFRLGDEPFPKLIDAPFPDEIRLRQQREADPPTAPTQPAMDIKSMASASILPPLIPSVPPFAIEKVVDVPFIKQAEIPQVPSESQMVRTSPQRTQGITTQSRADLNDAMSTLRTLQAEKSSRLPSSGLLVTPPRKKQSDVFDTPPGTLRYQPPHAQVTSTQSSSSATPSRTKRPSIFDAKISR